MEMHKKQEFKQNDINLEIGIQCKWMGITTSWHYTHFLIFSNSLLKKVCLSFLWYLFHEVKRIFYIVNLKRKENIHKIHDIIKCQVLKKNSKPLLCKSLRQSAVFALTHWPKQTRKTIRTSENYECLNKYNLLSQIWLWGNKVKTIRAKTESGLNSHIQGVNLQQAILTPKMN